MGVLSLAFRTKKEVRTFFLYLLFFQMPLAQNNFYAKVAYLGMAYTGTLQKLWVFPGGSDGKQFACNAGDPGSIPGWERSPGEGNGVSEYSSILTYRIP